MIVACLGRILSVQIMCCVEHHYVEHGEFYI